MKIKEKFANFTKSTALSLRRFPITSLFLLASCATALFMIITSDDFKALYNLLGCEGVGVFLFWLCELWHEKKKNSEKYSFPLVLVMYSACAAVLIIGFILLFFDAWESYAMLALCGMAAVAVLVSVRLLTRGDENVRNAALLIRAVVFAFAVGGIVWVGVSGCYGAFFELILNGVNISKGLLSIFVLSGTLAAFVFLSGVPAVGENREIMPGKAYKIVFVYAELPIFLLLLGILYIYLIKIAFSLHLPDGGINSYAMAADILYLFNLFAVSAFAPEQPLARFFRRFGGILILPVLVMQGLAVGVRVYYYGLTLPRMFIFYVMAATLALALGSFFKTGLSKALAFSAVLAFVLSVTPLNVINLPIWQQSASLKQTLVHNSMFENGKIVRKEDISAEEKQKITQSYDYLRSYPDHLPDWLTVRGIKANFGFERQYDYNERFETWCNYQGDALENGLDISDYSYILHVSASDRNVTKDGMFEFNVTDGHSFTISKQAVYDYAKKVYDKNFQDDDILLDPCEFAEGIDFVCESIHFAHDNETGDIRDLSFDGYLLCR